MIHSCSRPGVSTRWRLSCSQHYDQVYSVPHLRGTPISRVSTSGRTKRGIGARLSRLLFFRAARDDGDVRHLRDTGNPIGRGSFICDHHELVTRAIRNMRGPRKSQT